MDTPDDLEALVKDLLDGIELLWQQFSKVSRLIHALSRGGTRNVLLRSTFIGRANFTRSSTSGIM